MNAGLLLLLLVAAIPFAVRGIMAIEDWLEARRR